MAHFGIWLSRDGFFIGKGAGHWWGIHLDHWWSEDYVEYGAPLAVYIHLRPWKVWSWIGKENTRHPLHLGEAIKGGIQFRCAVQGCNWESSKTERPESFYVLKKRLHQLGGEDIGLGSSHMTLCPIHSRLEAAEKLEVQISER